MQTTIDYLNDLNPTVDDILVFEQTEEAVDPQRDEMLVDQASDEAADPDSVDCLKLYFQEMGRKSILTPQQEQELGKIIREGGEDAVRARNELVSANLRLAVYYAKRFQGRGVDLEDLISMANEGLIRAAEKYDYSLGYRFSTYASWWISQSLTRGIASESGAMRIPTHKSEQINKVKKVQKMYRQEIGEEPTPEEIAKRSGLTEQAVLDALQPIYTTVSFDSKAREDSDTTLGEFIMDENAVDPCESLMQAACAEAVRNALDMLPKKEALILKMRYGIGYDHCMTLDEIGSLPEFDLSRERIRQIEKHALDKIRRSPRIRGQLLEFVA